MIRLIFSSVVFFCTVSFVNGQDDFLLGAVSQDNNAKAHHYKLLDSCGFNTVELTQYIWQSEWNSGSLIDSFDMKGVKEKLELATSSNLNIVFVPRVHLDLENPINEFLWHGMIMPQGDDAIKDWFKMYGDFVLKYASLCEEYNVKIFAIGSELNALVATTSLSKVPDLYKYYLSKSKQLRTEKQLLKHKDKIDKSEMTSGGVNIYDNMESLIYAKVESQFNWANAVCFGNKKDGLEKMNKRRGIILQEWKKLIDKLRKVYSGKLCYAANFDSYREVNFWKDLDMMGINAYFPLTTYKSSCKPYPCLFNKSLRSWNLHLRSIMDYQRKIGLQNNEVIFTEIGYTKYSGSSFKPWKGEGYSIVPGFFFDTLIEWKNQKHEELERVAALEALSKSVKKNKFPLKALMYWQLSNDQVKLKEDAFSIYPNPNNGTIQILQNFLEE